MKKLKLKLETIRMLTSAESKIVAGGDGMPTNCTPKVSKNWARK